MAPPFPSSGPFPVACYTSTQIYTASKKRLTLSVYLFAFDDLFNFFVWKFQSSFTKTIIAGLSLQNRIKAFILSKQELSTQQSKRVEK